jgi:apolipoprotein D and lipocalin family protein
MKLLTLLFTALLGLASCATAPQAPTTVGMVDLARYAGKWYEQASFPMAFQKGCRNSTAEYTAQPDGSIKVVNTCTKADGTTAQVTGQAVVVPGSGNTKLKVSFFGPFTGDYWVIGLDPNYQWALVGHPDKTYLWLLTRQPDVSPALLEKMKSLAQAQGYDLTKLVITRSKE